MHNLAPLTSSSSPQCRFPSPQKSIHMVSSHPEIAHCCFIADQCFYFGVKKIMFMKLANALQGRSLELLLIWGQIKEDELKLYPLWFQETWYRIPLSQYCRRSSICHLKDAFQLLQPCEAAYVMPPYIGSLTAFLPETKVFTFSVLFSHFWCQASFSQILLTLQSSSRPCPLQFRFNINISFCEILNIAIRTTINCG